MTQLPRNISKLFKSVKGDKETSNNIKNSIHTDILPAAAMMMMLKRERLKKPLIRSK
jgi:hypothetical protein